MTLIVTIETPVAVERTTPIAVRRSRPRHGFGNDGKTCEVEDAIQRVLCAIRDAGNCTELIALTSEHEDTHGQAACARLRTPRPA